MPDLPAADSNLQHEAEQESSSATVKALNLAVNQVGSLVERLKRNVVTEVPEFVLQQWQGRMATQANTIRVLMERDEERKALLESRDQHIRELEAGVAASPSENLLRAGDHLADEVDRHLAFNPDSLTKQLRAAMGAYLAAREELGVAAGPSESEVLNAAWQIGQNHYWTLGGHHDGKWLDLRGFSALPESTLQVRPEHRMVAADGDSGPALGTERDASPVDDAGDPVAGARIVVVPVRPPGPKVSGV